MVVVEKDLTEARQGGIGTVDRGADREAAGLARVDIVAAHVPLVELDRWVILRLGFRPGLARQDWMLASDLEEDRSRPAENKVMVRVNEWPFNGRQDGKEINQLIITARQVPAMDSNNGSDTIRKSSDQSTVPDDRMKECVDILWDRRQQAAQEHAIEQNQVNRFSRLREWVVVQSVV